MAEKNKGILEMINRGILSAASYPYNFASDFTNAIPFVNTPYIDADADGFMQGGFVDKKDFDAVEGFGIEKLNKRIADKKAKDAGIAALDDSPTKKYTDMDQPNAMGGKTTSKKATENKKETTKKKEETDDKGMLQKLFERYDLVSLGADIASGKGLLEAVRGQEDTIKATAIAAEEKLYQRNREALSDALSISKAEVDKMYKQGLLSTDLIRDAEASADRQFPRGTAEHSRAFLDWMNTHADASVAKKMGLLTPQDVTKESMMRLMQDNSNFADITQDLVNAQQGILLEDSNAGAKDIDATAGIK